MTAAVISRTFEYVFFTGFILCPFASLSPQRMALLLHTKKHRTRVALVLHYLGIAKRLTEIKLF